MLNVAGIFYNFNPNLRNTNKRKKEFIKQQTSKKCPYVVLALPLRREGWKWLADTTNNQKT